jgi:hypothetical protein
MHVAYEPCKDVGFSSASGNCAGDDMSDTGAGRGDELEGVTIERIDENHQIVYLTMLNNGVWQTNDDASVLVWTVYDPVTTRTY